MRAHEVKKQVKVGFTPGSAQQGGVECMFMLGVHTMVRARPCLLRVARLEGKQTTNWKGRGLWTGPRPTLDISLQCSKSLFIDP